jgi:hypothetical protein
VRIKVNGAKHHVGVKVVGDDSVKIEVASEVQEAELKVGEEAKFELDGDAYYDVSVELLGIVDGKAQLEVGYIREFFREESVGDLSGTNVPADEEVGEQGEEQGKVSGYWDLYSLVLTSILIVLAGLAAFAVLVYRKKRG